VWQQPKVFSFILRFVVFLSKYVGDDENIFPSSSFVSFYLFLLILVSFFSLYIYHPYCLFLSHSLFFFWPAIKKQNKRRTNWFILNIFHSRIFYQINMPVREISNDSLNTELTAAGDKLVMVDFFATWFELFYFIFLWNYFILRCGPCKNIAPYIDNLSSQYPNAIFLKVDVEKCTVKINFLFYLLFFGKL